MMRVIIFFLFIGFQSFSQSITINDYEKIINMHYDKEKNEFLLFGQDSLTKIDIESLELISREEINYPNDKFSSIYEIVSLKSGIHFVERHGGQVYQLKGTDFIKVDKSYTHRMQMGSTLFVHNDTIFKYGGYGFWSMRNFFTYYDDYTSEWGIVSPSGSKEIPEGSQLSTVIISGDDIYVYGGFKLNPSEPLEYINNNEVWRFNLKSRTWKLLGESKIDLNSLYYNFSYGEKHIFYGRDDDRIVVVDVVNNKIKYFKKKKFQYGLKSNSFFNDGVFYCVLNNFTWDDFILLKRDEDDFFGELIDETQFYYNNEKIYYSIGVFLLGLLFLFSYSQFKKVRKKRNKIIVENDSLVYKGKILNFDLQCVQIINLLLNSEKEVISKDIMKITENPSLNYGHNTRVMNKTIEEINFKLRSILDCKEDLITFKKSETDKRIKVYSIDTSHFFVKSTF